jgi:hypothetical protein
VLQPLPLTAIHDDIVRWLQILSPHALSDFIIYQPKGNVASGSDKIFITFSNKEIAKETADTARENIAAEDMGILQQLDDDWLDGILDLHALKISEPEPVKINLDVTKPKNHLSSPGKTTLSKEDSLSKKRKISDTTGNNLSSPLHFNNYNIFIQTLCQHTRINKTKVTPNNTCSPHIFGITYGLPHNTHTEIEPAAKSQKGKGEAHKGSDKEKGTED